jgi:hypothetical protein
LIIPDRIIGSGWVSEIKEFAFNEKKYLQWNLFIPKSVKIIWRQAFYMSFSWDTENYLTFEDW